MVYDVMADCRHLVEIFWFVRGSLSINMEFTEKKTLFYLLLWSPIDGVAWLIGYITKIDKDGKGELNYS